MWLLFSSSTPGGNWCHNTTNSEPSRRRNGPKSSKYWTPRRSASRGPPPPPYRPRACSADRSSVTSVTTTYGVPPFVLMILAIWYSIGEHIWISNEFNFLNIYGTISLCSIRIRNNTSNKFLLVWVIPFSMGYSTSKVWSNTMLIIYLT